MNFVIRYDCLLEQKSARRWCFVFIFLKGGFEKVTYTKWVTRDIVYNNYLSKSNDSSHDGHKHHYERENECSENFSFVFLKCFIKSICVCKKRAKYKKINFSPVYRFLSPRSKREWKECWVILWHVVVRDNIVIYMQYFLIKIPLESWIFSILCKQRFNNSSSWYVKNIMQ